MRQVVAKRDANWKKLRSTSSTSASSWDVRGTQRVAIWGERRSTRGSCATVFFIRSPVKVNGVAIGEPTGGIRGDGISSRRRSVKAPRGGEVALGPDGVSINGRSTVAALDAASAPGVTSHSSNQLQARQSALSRGCNLLLAPGLPKSPTPRSRRLRRESRPVRPERHLTARGRFSRSCACLRYVASNFRRSASPMARRDLDRAANEKTVAHEP